jgi:molecular chaperone DnaJ
MDTQESYEQLGLLPSASDAQLKAAWRRLVSLWHPDRNRSSEAAARIQLINKAYQKIRQCRAGALEEAAEPDSPQRPAEPAPAAADNGAAAQAQAHVRKVCLTLEEAALGCTRSMRGRWTCACVSCAGLGEQVLLCQACRGKGTVRQALLFGWSWTELACKSCGGEGVERKPCSDCLGQGHREIAYRRSVRIPAGVRDGVVLTVSLAQEGHELGLELHVALEPHPFFVLEGNVLSCEMPVSGYAWMANCWVEVPAPEGLTKMRLRRDALDYRLPGQGFPLHTRGPRGDLLVRIAPTFDDDGDAAHQALLARLIEASTCAAQVKEGHPLAQWRQRLQGWRPQAKEAPPSS